MKTFINVEVVTRIEIDMGHVRTEVIFDNEGKAIRVGAMGRWIRGRTLMQVVDYYTKNGHKIIYD